jgi:hypothetical protein
MVQRPIPVGSAAPVIHASRACVALTSPRTRRIGARSNAVISGQKVAHAATLKSCALNSSQ